MHDDPIARLTEVWDEVDVLAQKMEAAAQPGRSWAGADRAGAVNVTVNGEGHVAEVRIQPDWRRRISGEDLANAVREAAEAAALSRFESWGEAFAEQESRPGPRPRPMPALGDSLAYQLDELATAKMSSDDGRAAVRELLALLESVEQRVDQASAQLQVQAAAVYTGYNTSRDVSVTVNAGGLVSDVSYNRHWLLNTTPSSIGRETVSAFEAAYREASLDSPEAGLRSEVQGLSQDPFGLARRLHLRD
ncbi:hypothetical protein AB0J86_04950 [Micromonospora sp. NPDC049559]|uniref:hypothetical protein n=1 Tax=Micromonospora sp. NPDC049559 TaxID=3155923 RepID=UPI003449CD5B